MLAGHSLGNIGLNNGGVLTFEDKISKIRSKNAKSL